MRRFYLSCMHNRVLSWFVGETSSKVKRQSPLREAEVRDTFVDSKVEYAI